MRDYPANGLTEDQRAQLAADLANLASVAVRLAVLAPAPRLDSEPQAPLELSGLSESALMAMLAALTGRILGSDVKAS